MFSKVWSKWMLFLEVIENLTDSFLAYYKLCPLVLGTGSIHNMSKAGVWGCLKILSEEFLNYILLYEEKIC